MSKRELGQLNGANEVEGPRTKRRRETAGASSDVDVTSSDHVVSSVPGGGESSGAKKEDVQELGLKLWQTVKDAVNKEGRPLATDFLRRPSKRLYPDYYQLIERPIALDDIKKQIDTGGYPTLAAVRQDFELCFSNAKQYNMKESDIWRDAKDLLKLANKTYNKLLPPDEDNEDGSKSKAPNLSRLMKARLQKLVDKTDESSVSLSSSLLSFCDIVLRGRQLSVEFIDLPSKKDWPLYYKEIKRPQCIESIFKHIKRKEYTQVSDFAADVELVFANAMAFNQEHTGIWEDAKTLRDYFHVLMSDMPAPYLLPEYAAAKPKIKIKPQPAQTSTLAPTAPLAQPTASTSQTLRIIASKQQIKASPAPTPTMPAVSLPVAAATPPPAPPVPTPQPVQYPSMGAPQPIQYMNTTFSHYPNASYIPPAPLPAAPTPSTSTSSLPTYNLAQAHSASNSPAPPLHPSHQLRSISLVIKPRGRNLNLDHEDGVKCWAMRLIPGETDVHVSGVAFMGGEEEESSGGEEEDDEEEEEEVEAPAKNGWKRGKAKRGRPTRAAAKAKAATVKKKKQKPGPIQVKLNGTVVQENEEAGKWVVRPTVGESVLETHPLPELHKRWKTYRTVPARMRTLKSSTVVWDTSSWGTPKQDANADASTSSIKTDRVLSSSSSSSWGAPASDPRVQPKIARKGSGSGSAGVGMTSGWGDRVSGSDSGWGDTSDGWTPVESAWNEGLKNASKEADTGSPWGSFEDKGKGKADEKDVQWGNDWTTDSGGWSTEPRPSPSANPTSQIAPAAEVPTPTSHHPLPGPQSSATNVTQPGKENKAILKIITQIPAAEPVLSSRSDSVQAPQDPHSVEYHQTQQAVYYHLELEEAQASVEQWKRTQTSSQYARATPATRTTLDSQRLQFAQRAGKAKQDLTSALKRIVETNRVILHSRASLDQSREAHVKQDFVKYTADLRDWIQALELQNRVIPPEPLAANSSPKLERPQDPKEFLHHHIQSIFGSMEELMDLINEKLYFRDSEPIDVDARMATTLRDVEEKRQEALSMVEVSATHLLQEANQTRDGLREVSHDTTPLIATMLSNSQILVELNAQLEQTEKHKEQVQGYLSQLSEMKKVDESRIRDLTERLKNLYKVPRPSIPPLSPDDLLSSMQKLLTGNMQAEIIFIVDRLHYACSTSSDTFITELLKWLEPILEKTNKVCRRAEVLTAEYPNLLL
ncbi:hypothetical protein DXG03_008466 [Asterophora parasitica]|uniref:Bromo domain-containing protein n=1 Tax=Asterophora parasitica TaxID=117018 RepID=A0A9P7KEN9_9AGAR|nr:hypothetical protein DXG03_008466 [Asterophora parasitica]